MQIRIITCPSCGGNLDQQALMKRTCPYCGHYLETAETTQNRKEDDETTSKKVSLPNDSSVDFPEPMVENIEGKTTNEANLEKIKNLISIGFVLAAIGMVVVYTVRPLTYPIACAAGICFFGGLSLILASPFLVQKTTKFFPNKK